MKLIVGLGNPGPEYEQTRHNVGFVVLESLAKRWDVRLRKEKRGPYCFGTAKLGHQTVLLATPQTFMNESGQAVKQLLGKTGIDPSEMVVVYDDIDLELGRVRIRLKGGHGGHNGMRSILSLLRTDDFVRLRVGVGRPSAGKRGASHVLGDFKKAERPLLEQVVGECVDALACMTEEGVEKAMNLYNKKLGALESEGGKV